MFNFFTKEKFGTGALLDQRSQFEREKDIQFKEVVANAAAVDWVEKPKDKWRTFPVFNQGQGNSCVANSGAKELGIIYFLKNGTYVPFSRLHLYKRRINAPTGGMDGADCSRIMEEGVTLEELVPGDKKTDIEIDTTEIPEYKKKVGEIFKAGKGIVLPIKDIDAVASTIQETGKGVMVWFYFNANEWSKEVPTVMDESLSIFSALRHSVVAVDFTLYKGKKALIIEDSAHFGGINRRIITEDFFSKRNFYSKYTLNFKFDDPVAKPSYVFIEPMFFGDTSTDIKNLQLALQNLGYFATNLPTTGYYGAYTADAVYRWQKDYQVASLEELRSLQGKRFGDKSILKMNELLNNQ